MKIWFKSERWWVEDSNGNRRKFKTEEEANSFAGITQHDETNEEWPEWKSVDET